MLGWFEVDNWEAYREASTVKASAVTAVVKNQPENDKDQGCVIVLIHGTIAVDESYDSVITKLTKALEEN